MKMKRFLMLVTAFVVAMGVLAVGLAATSRTVERTDPTVTAPTGTGSTHVNKVISMKVGHQTRSWLTISPAATLPTSAPIIVMLSGIGASARVESRRDRLIPYVDAGKAELIYPIAVKESWNAGRCCGAAARQKVDDVSFLKKLVAVVDLGHTRPIYFVGYSNGGRMVYQLECTDPGLFDAMAIMKADPMPGCVVRHPQNVLVVSALDDPAVPFETGEKGKETPAATVQIARLRRNLGCATESTRSTRSTHGSMTFTTWSSCTDGKRLAWAVYTIGGHNFPPPTANTPSGSQVIWSFFTQTALAPLPT
jgi:polyhydroxybutyrate depolymerase